MDEAALRAAETDLLAWGLLEPTPEGPRWTRRFRAGVARAAAGLAEVEKAGKRVEGGPLRNTVRMALQLAELPPGAAPTEMHEQLLVAVELAALPEALRKYYV